MPRKVLPTAVSLKQASKKASPERKASKSVSSKTSKKISGKTLSKILVLSEPNERDNIALNVPINRSVSKPQEKVVTSSVASSTRPVLTPFMLSEHSLSNVARIAGILFIVLGASFTTANLQSIAMNDVTSMQLQALTYTTTNSLYSTGDTDDQPRAGDADPGISLQNSARIDVDNTTDAQTYIPVLIHTDLATRVSVLTVNVETRQSISAGNAEIASGGSWSKNINTSRLLPGTYRVKAIIATPYGSFTQMSQSSFTIDDNDSEGSSAIEEEEINHENDVSGDNESSDTQATSSIETEEEDLEIELNQDRIVILEEGALEGSVPIAILSKNLSNPTLYARNKATNILYFIGKGVLIQSGEWGVTWNTNNVPNGKYILMSRDKDNERKYLDHTIVVSVRNDISTTTKITNMEGTFEQPTVNLTQPKISIQDFQSPVQEYERILVTVDTESTKGELYLLPNNSSVPTFLGSLRKSKTNEWIFDWDTQNTPNGKYSLYARLTRGIHSVDSNMITLEVSNVIVQDYSREQEEFFTKTSSAQEELTKIEGFKSDSNTGDVVYVKPVEEFIVDSVPKENRVAVEARLLSYKQSFEEYRNEYARLIRANDHESVSQVENKFAEIQSSLLNDLPSLTNEQKVIDDVQRYIGESSHAILETTKKNENIIRERIGEDAIKDDDMDDITNYDEINLYKTDPFSADTDGDGYRDGDEVINGYNPILSVREATVEYQSPKENGVIRDDILQVVAIETFTTDVEEEGSGSPKALITGRALPNSFVTLHIFSTPVVVTVKTDADGNWTYVFDKDIDEGEHEIYIAITDNTGQIVARSEPFAFVRTAEAFEVAATLPLLDIAPNAEPSLIHNKSMLIIASLAVVGLGLVLLLLGIHVQVRRPELNVVQSA